MESTQQQKCLNPECSRARTVRGYCATHYAYRHRHGLPLEPPTQPRSSCAVAGCTAKHHAHGYCAVHNARFRRSHGDPLKTVRTTTSDSFWSRVDKAGEGGCWLWTGTVYKTGYGGLATRLRLTPGGSRLAHRAAYQLLVGPIPEGLHLDHLCRVRRCVNPAHLEPVTPKENARRGLRGALKTHCPHGHPLTAENMTVRSLDGARVCHPCVRASEATRNEANAYRIGIHPGTLQSRLRRGWPLEEAMARPVRAGGNRKGSRAWDNLGASVRAAYSLAGQS